MGVFAEKLVKHFNSYPREVGVFFNFLSLKMTNPASFLDIHHAFWSILTTPKYKQFPRKRNDEEVKCQILAKATYPSQNKAGVVGNRVILCTLKARKHNYSGAKWRLFCNVCWNLIHWKVSPWHRNISTFKERETLNGTKCPQSL